MVDLASPWFTTYAVHELELTSLVLEAIGAYWQYVVRVTHPSLVNSINPLTVTDPGIRLRLIMHDGWNLQHVPMAERTHMMCALAVQQCGRVIQHVPNPTAEICRLAVINTGRAMGYIPEVFHTYDLLRAMIQHDPLNIKHMSYELQQQYPDLCLMALSMNGWALKDIYGVPTSEMEITAVTQDPEIVRLVPTLTVQNLAAAIIGHLSRMPESNLRQELTELAHRLAVLARDLPS